MTKVTIDQAPQQTSHPSNPVKVAGGEEFTPYQKRLRTTTDSLGREITFEKPTALQNMRLFGLVDEKSARSQGYMLYARLACSVRSVTGSSAELIPMHTPQTIAELEASVQLLDEEGIAAVMAGWVAEGWISLGDDTAGQADLVKDAAKN